MIIDRDNPVSIEYSEISKKSYQPLIDDGTIEIIDFDAVNLKTSDQYQSKYNFKPSLVLGQRTQEHHPTEIAGMCSHFELLKKQAETPERFIILEHDSYLLEPDLFRQCIKLIEEENLCYANVGLFFSCYTVSQNFAKWAYNILTEHNFPINCGPYVNMNRLIQTYLSRDLAPEQDYTYLVPVRGFKNLYMGKYEYDIKKIFVTEHIYSFDNPTTQVISDRLNVTQYHHGFRDKFIKTPHKRHPWFKCID